MSTDKENFGEKGGSYDIPKPTATVPIPGGPPKPRGLPVPRKEITVHKGQLHVAGDEALKAVAERRPAMIYTWGDLLAQIISVPDPLHPVEQPPQPRIHVLDEHALADVMNRVVAFQKLVFDKGSGKLEPTPIDSPAQLVKWVRSRGQWRDVLPIAGIREGPTLLPSGRMISVPGYDAPSGLFLSFKPDAFPTGKEKPDKDDAIAALKVLEQLLVGFPFCSEVARAALLSSIISGVARTAFPLAPLHLATAPVQSSGKSTASALPALVATGREPMSISPGTSDEEADKRVLAALCAGRSFVSLDNLIGEFELASVARAITEPTYGGRILGMSKTVDLPTTATLWTGSGNNVIPRGDLVSRTIPIPLDPQNARPWLQKRANRSPRLVAVERRGEFFMAALTIVRAYIADDCPDVKLGGFRLEEWARFVRAPLVWLGQADPLEGMRQSEERDPEMELLRELVVAWDDCFGDRLTTVADAVDASATGSTALLHVLRTVSRSALQVEARRVGRYLAAHEKRIVDDRRFVRCGNRGAAVLWRLERVKSEVSSVGEVSFAPPRGDAEGDESHVRGANSTSPTHQTPMPGFGDDAAAWEDI